MVSCSAVELLRRLVPGCSASVFVRLHQEGVRTAADLAQLDKDDLQKLGLNMVERNKVMQWAYFEEREQGLFVPGPFDHLTSPGRLENCDHSYAVLEELGGEAEVAHRLDEVEQKAGFWCDIIASTRSGPLPHCFDGDDVRENVLEMLFDLTPERVKEVYDCIDRDHDGCITVAELGRGLQQYNLPELSDGAIKRVLELVTAQRSSELRLHEFEAVLSRLKLAQVFVSFSGALTKLQTGRTCADQCAKEQLTIIDYSPKGIVCALPVQTDAQLRDFCFGHRQAALGAESLVRWVHLSGLDLMIMLLLTVKYSLHPLSVEDVIEQSPAKMDRTGCNYFVAIQQICLASADDGSQPVRVRGRHVSVFCAGEPYLDTLLSVAQQDRSFAADWPGGVENDEDGPDASQDQWDDRLRQRLRAPLSRLRERRADYLMYQIIDLSTDELMVVSRAYAKRLAHLEEELRDRGPSLPASWPVEVSCARLRLAVVRRRIVGVQRMLRRLTEDPHMGTSLSGYLQDVLDHLHEASEDVIQSSERCVAIEDMYERVVDRWQERSQQAMADRLNKMLFVLTVATTIFAPVQFLAGVYGMNFEKKDGEPNIPELMMVNGYYIFWLVVLGYFVLSSAFAVWLFRRLHHKKKDLGDAGAGHAYGSPNPSSNSQWVLQGPGASDHDIERAMLGSKGNLMRSLRMQAIPCCIS